MLKRSRTLEEVSDSREFQSSLNALQEGLPASVAASERLSRILSSLKSFAHLDEAPFQTVGLESTTTLIEPEVRGRIDIVKKYGDVPIVRCIPAEMNQVFLNLLTNATRSRRSKVSGESRYAQLWRMGMSLLG